MQRKNGIVAIIDALGTKTASIESAYKYITSIDTIKAVISNSHSKILNHKLFKESTEHIKELKLRFFGDTILLTLELKDKQHERACIEAFSTINCIIIHEGARQGILFRGSIAIGEYLESTDAVLGPAIYDAASWYEKLNSIGIIATPQTRFILDTILLDKEKDAPDEKPLSGMWINYNAPLKTSKIEAKLLNWPIGYVIDAKDKNDATLEFLKVFSKFVQPSGTEEKYINAKAFFEFVLDLHAKTTKTWSN